jgi:hypothetical protein
LKGLLILKNKKLAAVLAIMVAAQGFIPSAQAEHRTKTVISQKSPMLKLDEKKGGTSLWWLGGAGAMAALGFGIYKLVDILKPEVKEPVISPKEPHIGSGEEQELVIPPEGSHIDSDDDQEPVISPEDHHDQEPVIPPEDHHDNEFCPTRMPKAQKCPIDLDWLAEELAADRKVDFTEKEEEINTLLEKFEFYVNNCPPVVQFEMGGRVVIGSDFHSHGSGAALWYEEAKKALEEGGSAVSLGDMIDPKALGQNENSAGVAVLIFGLAIKYPGKVICLRGNHEMIGGPVGFTFGEEQMLNNEKMTQQDIRLKECLKKLPMAAITRSDNGLVLFVHSAPPKLACGGAGALLAERFRHHSPEVFAEFLCPPFQCIVWDRLQSKSQLPYQPSFREEWDYDPSLCPLNSDVDTLTEDQVRERLDERFARVFVGHDHRNFDQDKVSMVCTLSSPRHKLIAQVAIFNKDGNIQRIDREYHP